MNLLRRQLERLEMLIGGQPANTCHEKVLSAIKKELQIQGWAKEWSLGCENSRPAARGVRRRDSHNLGTTLLPSPVDLWHAARGYKGS